jgi:acetyl-CoA carboxylase biotin carboxyl carrier protein
VANIAKKSGPFDVKTVEALVALMSQHDLSEIYLREGTQHVRLRRGAVASVVVPAATMSPHAPALPAAASTPAANSAESKPAAPSASKKNLIEIKSETVGTYYAQPKPGEPAYVKIGDRVTPNKPVGLVEVMKTYNEILANCTGVVREILVENGTFVEFGQVLFRVDPEG